LVGSETKNMLLLLFLAGLAEGDFKETFLFRRGDSLPLVHTTEQAPAQCWQYTWLGAANERVNYTATCSDLLGDEEGAAISKPCFSPLVWTENDENGANQPDLDELEAACEKVPGCSVHCTPGPSERCIKYTEFSAGKLAYTSSFCGRITLDWTNESPDNSRCYKNEDGNLEYCYQTAESCVQDRGDYNCNSSPSLQLAHFSSSAVLLILLFLFR